jgi:antitoxin Phd
VLSAEDYRRMLARQPSLKDWLLSGPRVEGFETERDRDRGRDVEL